MTLPVLLIAFSTTRLDGTRDTLPEPLNLVHTPHSLLFLIRRRMACWHTGHVVDIVRRIHAPRYMASVLERVVENFEDLSRHTEKPTEAKFEHAAPRSCRRHSGSQGMVLRRDCQHSEGYLSSSKGHRERRELTHTLTTAHVQRHGRLHSVPTMLTQSSRHYFLTRPAQRLHTQCHNPAWMLQGFISRKWCACLIAFRRTCGKCHLRAKRRNTSSASTSIKHLELRLFICKMLSMRTAIRPKPARAWRLPRFQTGSGHGTYCTKSMSFHDCASQRGVPHRQHEEDRPAHISRPDTRYHSDVYQLRHNVSFESGEMDGKSK